jgi:DNA mismatch repair protein MutS
MLKHWREVKARHPDTILFYRVGDFYEMFHEDAQVAARLLEITLTSRGDGVPLAGVPVKAAAEYLRQLVGAGHRSRSASRWKTPSWPRGWCGARWWRR